MLKVIWDYKWLTVSLCTLAIIASVFYALNAQEWWVAKGKVLAPQLNDVSTLYSQSKVASEILSQTQASSEILAASSTGVPPEFDNLFEPQNLFDNFTNEFKSSAALVLGREADDQLLDLLGDSRPPGPSVLRSVVPPL